MKRRNFFSALFGFAGAAAVAPTAVEVLPMKKLPGWSMPPAVLIEHVRFPRATYNLKVTLDFDAAQFQAKLKQIIQENQGGIREDIIRAMQQSTYFESSSGLKR